VSAARKRPGPRGLLGAAAAFALIAWGAAAASAIEPGAGAVAVWNVDSVMPGEPSAEAMGELMAGRIIEAFREASYSVVERERIDLALAELKLGSTALAAEDTRLRIGRTLGARFMVFGNLIRIGDTWRLDLRLVDVETGRVLKAVERSAAGVDPLLGLRLAQEAAEQLR
jgi:TolB-like protein